MGEALYDLPLVLERPGLRNMKLDTADPDDHGAKWEGGRGTLFSSRDLDLFVDLNHVAFFDVGKSFEPDAAFKT